MLFPLLGLAGVVGVAGFLAWERHDMAKTCIQADLLRSGAADARIEFDWTDFDRDTFTYDVTFTDRSGQRVANRCKVAVRAGAERTVYWARPLA